MVNRTTGNNAHTILEPVTHRHNTRTPSQSKRRAGTRKRPFLQLSQHCRLSNQRTARHASWVVQHQRYQKWTPTGKSVPRPCSCDPAGTVLLLHARPAHTIGSSENDAAIFTFGRCAEGQGNAGGEGISHPSTLCAGCTWCVACRLHVSHCGWLALLRCVLCVWAGRTVHQRPLTERR